MNKKLITQNCGKANKNLRSNSSFNAELPSISYLDAGGASRFDLNRSYSTDWGCQFEGGGTRGFS